jgi:hypothetical protein
MAIEIIPRGKIKLPPWVIVLGGLTVILLIVFLGSYLCLEISVRKLSREIQEKEPILTPLGEAIKAEEEKLGPISEKLNDFSGLLQRHKSSLNIFSFLEQICLPTVWFSGFNFTSENTNVIVSGQTNSFVTLEQQILVLKQDPLVENLSIAGVSVSEKGEVNFTFLLTFSPKILTR